MKKRAAAKAARFLPWMPGYASGCAVLDLGAAEGYVGLTLHQETGAEVVLADVVDIHRVALPFVLLGEGALPFDADTFDITVLAFVLHHAVDAEQLLQETVRVTRKRVLILESVYRTGFELQTLRLADTLANRIRSSGAMAAQEPYLHFRTETQWRSTLQSYGTLITAQSFGCWPHRQALFALDL